MAVKLGNLQLKIMRVLWQNGEATARQITEAINQEEVVAHSTIQTLLRKLQAKNAVGHEERDRTFYFRALVSEEVATTSATQDLLSRVFQGSISGMVAHVLDSEKVSKEEIERLKRIVDEKSKELQ